VVRLPAGRGPRVVVVDTTDVALNGVIVGAVAETPLLVEA